MKSKYVVCYKKQEQINFKKFFNIEYNIKEEINYINV